MHDIPNKLKPAIRLSCERLLSRAENDRGISPETVAERVSIAVSKYLLSADPSTDARAVEEFVAGLHADELCLILACERGDEPAWEDLVSLQDATVRSAARKTAANAEDADDLASSIWAELYGIRVDASGVRKSKLAYYSGRGSLGGWLRAVVAQLAVDAYRKTSRYVQVEEDRELEVLANSSDSPIGDLHSGVADPESALLAKNLRRDLSAAIRSAVDILPSEDRLIIKLYYFDGLKLKQIADTFGYHEATASRKLARIQSDLRKHTERCLLDDHGWTEKEIDSQLSDAAAAMGLDVEKMFAAIAVFIVLQDIWR